MSPYYKEFQAVVMAGGKGSRLTDLTSSSKAKCLLPVGNVPMIWYSLHMLQKMGFKEVIVVVQESTKIEVGAIPEKYGLDLILELFVLPNDEDLGTADALRLINNRLHAKSIMIVSSDLITNVAINNLSDLHRIHNSSVTALYTPTTSNFDPKTIKVPGPRTNHKRERDLVGLDKNNNQMCFLSSEADIEEFVTLKKSLLKEHPRITIHSNLMDAHLYIFEKWVLDFLSANDTFSVIKSEFLPYLVKKQFNPLNKITLPQEEETPAKPSENKKSDIFSFIPECKAQTETQSLSSWNDHSGDMEDAYHNRPLRCYAYVMDAGGICVRANNLPMYCEVNRKLPLVFNSVGANLPTQHPRSQIQPKAVIGPETFVGEGTFISDKTTIKNCVIGQHCRVEEKVRLTDCIIMDSVVIKEGSKITGSLICDGVIFEAKSDVKNCIIGKSQTVTEGSTHVNELIQDMDRMMEV